MVDGGEREWTLPEGWEGEPEETLFPLSATGCGSAVKLAVRKGRVNLELQPGAAYVVERTAG